MQHDLIELLDAIKYAKENFSDDESAKFHFIRKEKTDGLGKPYREDKVKFECVIVIAWACESQVKITVVGLGDDVQFQREWIAKAIEEHRQAKA